MGVMALLPKTQWDFFLQSPMRLADRVDLRFDLKGGRCLRDDRSGCSWGLQPWQGMLLRELESGASFAEAVRDVIAFHPESATREAIANLVNGLRDRGLLRLDRPERRPIRPVPREWSAPPRWLLRVPHHWACQLTAFAMAVWGISSAISSDSSRVDPPSGKDGDRIADGVEVSCAGEAAEAVEVRAWCDGVITELMVMEGDDVKPGDVLAVVADPMALSTRDDLRHLLGDCRIRRDAFYQSGDPAAYLSESRTLARLARELSEWELQCGPVVLRSPIEGRVHYGKPSETVGARVTSGDVIMTIESSPAGDGTEEGDTPFLATTH